MQTNETLGVSGTGDFNWIPVNLTNCFEFLVCRFQQGRAQGKLFSANNSSPFSLNLKNKSGELKLTQGGKVPPGLPV